VGRSLAAIMVASVWLFLEGGEGVDVSTLATLLDERRFGECREAAESLLRTARLTDAERAQAFLALSYGLAALHDGQEALGPAELAVHFGHQSREYDITGHALCHLATLCYETRLYKRAVGCLDKYFQLFTLYKEARGLEGWVLAHMGLFHQAMGRGAKALEYFQKAYRWHLDQNTCPQQLDLYRGDLAWHLLRMGDVDQVEDLLARTRTYLTAAPNDLDARARYLNNAAYRCYLTGDYGGAVHSALQAVHMRGVSATRKAQAYLTLHYTAKARHMWKEARGLGTLARIQASVARRADLEEEATRALVQMQQGGGVPLMEELFRSLTLMEQQTAATGESPG
jgi:tetratricopeptide (TPR) repeat protein